MSPGTRRPARAQDVEDAGGAAVVEDGDGGRPGFGVEQGPCGRGAVVLGEAAGQDAGVGVEAVPAHRFAVAAAALGGAGGAAAVDVGDSAVAEVDEVVDGLVQAGGVVGADDVDGAVADGAGHDDDRHPGGELGQVGGGRLRAEQDQRLAAVLQQARDRPVFVAVRGDGAERELVADAIGGRVEAADEVAVEGVLDAEHHAEQPTAAAAQQAGPAVGAVAQLVRGLQDPLPRLPRWPRARPASRSRPAATDTPARAATSARVGRRRARAPAVPADSLAE